MAMEVDALGSDLEEPDSDVPPPKKAAAKKAAAPTKKVPVKGRGKKAIAVSDLLSCQIRVQQLT